MNLEENKEVRSNKLLKKIYRRLKNIIFLFQDNNARCYSVCGSCYGSNGS